MDRPALTVRLPESTRAALSDLSKIERKPVNQLIVAAIEAYLSQSREAEQDLAATLAALNRYRKSDPDYSKAFSAFVDAEATLGKGDTVEGTVVIDKGKAQASPAQSAVAEILGA